MLKEEWTTKMDPIQLKESGVALKIHKDYGISSLRLQKNMKITGKFICSIREKIFPYIVNMY